MISSIYLNLRLYLFIIVDTGGNTAEYFSTLHAHITQEAIGRQESEVEAHQPEYIERLVEEIDLVTEPTDGGSEINVEGNEGGGGRDVDGNEGDSGRDVNTSRDVNDGSTVDENTSSGRGGGHTGGGRGVGAMGRGSGRISRARAKPPFPTLFNTDEGKQCGTHLLKEANRIGWETTLKTGRGFRGWIA